MFKVAGGFPSKYCSIAHKEFRASHRVRNADVDSCVALTDWPKTRACCAVRPESKATGTFVGLRAPRKRRAKARQFWRSLRIMLHSRAVRFWPPSPSFVKVSLTLCVVAAQFKTSWRHQDKTCPTVRHIYKIVSDQASSDKYTAYR